MRFALIDNQVGLPEDLNFEKLGTLGLQLVSLLVKQLRRTIELSRSPGTRFRIRFLKHEASP